MKNVLHEEVDGVICVPTFFDGGRITFDDVHYMIDGENLVPVGETAFAKDAHFGYTSSNLFDWIIEKSKGSISESNITSISIEDIRNGGPQRICDILEESPRGQYFIVNGKFIFFFFKYSL